MVNTGHCHPRIIAAVQEQMERFTHTCFQVVMYEPYIALAERLNALVPISGAVKSAFFTTGAEATENAVKIARAATGRSGGPCCTVRLVNALRPTHALSLGNADGLRSSKLKHPVQRMNSDGGFRHATLVRPRAQCISHHSFQAADR